MFKKLTKHGNSQALIIDKPILKLLNIKEDTKLEIKIEDNSLIITPVLKKTSKTKKVITNKKLEQLIAKNIEKYAPALKKLAKN